MARKKFQWWHAVVIFVVVNLLSGLPAGMSGDQAFYNSFKLPSVAPPDWLFPPMWLFLNITSLMALYRVANAPACRSRAVFLSAEGIGWFLFSIFATLYFGFTVQFWRRLIRSFTQRSQLSVSRLR